MPVSELIDGQVEDDDGLEAEQALSLAPALANPRPRVEVEPTDHEDRHHGRLQHDPTLFDPVADRGVIRVLIEILRFHEIGMKVIRGVCCRFNRRFSHVK